jgi:hypothetical protein
MGCGDVGGGSTTNIAGRYIGTDPVGEGGGIHAGQDEEHQAGHGGYYKFIAWGGCLPPGGEGGEEMGKPSGQGLDEDGVVGEQDFGGTRGRCRGRCR